MKQFFLSKSFRLIVTLGLLSVLLLSLYVWRWLHTPQELPEHVTHIELLPGDSLLKVANRLRAEIGLRHPRVLVAYAKLVNKTNIKLGEYDIPSSMTPVELLNLLHGGKVKLRALTLVEGITFRDALGLISSQGSMQHTLQGESLQAVRDRLGIEYENPEGWLFPDTYMFSKYTTDWNLIQQAHQRMRDVLQQEWLQRAEGLPYESPYEALIMASIIEKETGAPQERAEIAGVFVRRLQKGMRLQTDPTVIYGMGDAYQGKISRKHLRQKTPYNTYTIRGLPPTPIALPGREAIHAALHPAAGESLYFVAKGDGTHYFSSTLEEHQRAVKKYQLQRAENYRSTLQ